MTAQYQGGKTEINMAEQTAAWTNPEGLAPTAPTAPAAPTTAAGAPADTLRVEHLLYAGILVLALLTRLIGLGDAPLAPFEAAQSWPALLAATGASVANAPVPTSALFYGLQSAWFFVFGANDLLARLLPAFMGVALAWLPWLWRRWLGRTAALVAALLLALDPWLTALSRRADGTGLSVFFGLLALTALWHWFASPASALADQTDPADPHTARSRLRWERTLAVSTALLLVTGVQAWSWLPVLALFGVLTWRLYPQSPGTQAGPQRSTWLWFGGALLLGATGLLARPEAVGSVGASLSAWLAQWTGPSADGAAGFDLGWPLLRLLADQPLLAVFGLAGLVLLATGRGLPHARQQALFLALWLVWGVVLLALPGRSAFVLPMIGLPLLLAAASAIGWLIDLPRVDAGGLELTILLAVATVLVIAGSVWLAMVVDNQLYDTRLALTAALLAVLTLAIWIMFGLWAGWGAAAKVAGLFFAGVLLVATVRSNGQLSHDAAMMEPNGLFATVTLPEARLLAADIGRISSLRHGDPYEQPVQVVTGDRAPDPVLGWLLRDLRKLTWVAAPQTDPAPFEQVAGATPPALATRLPLVIAPLSLQDDPALAGMLGAKYPLTMRWTPADLPQLPPVTQEVGASGLPAAELAQLRADQQWTQSTRPLLEWLIYRTVKTPPAVENVTLWAAP